VTGWGQVRVQKQAVEGNDPHRGHEYVCEGDMVHVGVRRVSHGVVELKILCFGVFFIVFNLPHYGQLS